MARAYLVLSSLALLALACGDDTAATGAGTTGSTTADSTTDVATSTTGGPTEPPTTGGPGTITGVTTDATTTAPGTTGPDATTTVGPTSDPGTTTDPGTTDPGTSTGGPGVCGLDGPDVGAELVQVDKPAPPCGPLEFTGTRISDEKGPVWQLDGCACGQNCLIPDPWTLSVSAPPQWLPLVPACPRIVVERAMGFGGCEFVAMSVWDLAVPNAPAVYHAGHGFSPTQVGKAELTLTPHSLGTCACEGCCGLDELWDLQFTFAGADATLSEGESAKLGTHDAINLESHQSGLCDAPGDIHWVVRRPG